MGRREEKKQEKRARLEASALDLFDQLGYDRASIELIAAASDVARGTYYLYFPDKLALFAALSDRWFVPMRGLLVDTGERVAAARTPADLIGIWTEMGVGLALLGVAYPREIAIAFRELRRSGEAGEELRRRETDLLDIAVAFTRTAADAGLLQTRDPRLSAYVVYGAGERLYWEMLRGTDLGDPMEGAREVVRIFARAFGLGDVEVPLLPR